MKCKYCNSEIKGNDNFCPYCGKEVQQNVKESDTKSSNGELTDTLQPYQKRMFSTKWIWIILGLFLFCAVIALFHFSSSSDKTYISSDNNEPTQEISKNPDENEIYKRVEEIYSTVYKGGKLEGMEVDDYDWKFCSFNYIGKKAELTRTLRDYGMLIEQAPEVDHWTLTMGDCDNRYDWKILEAQKTSEDKATAKVQINACTNETHVIGLDLIYERKGNEANWYINDFRHGTNSEKEGFYIQVKNIMESVDNFFSDYGEKYNIDGVECISYVQMKKIAQNGLNVSEINGYAKYIDYSFDEATIERDYQTPKYEIPSSAFFEVRLSRDSGKMHYNFWCRTKDKNEEYYDRLCKDLEEDANEVMEIGSGYRGFVNGVEYIEIVRDNTYIYVRILTNN